MAGIGSLWIASNRDQRWLVTSRGLILLTHPNPINALADAGVPTIPFDDAGMDAIKTVFKNAP